MLNMYSGATRWAFCALVAASLLPAGLLPTTAFAQEEVPPDAEVVPDDGFRSREDTYETGRGIGMGGGGRANAQGTSAVAYNPANISLGRVYHMEANLGYAAGQSAWSTGASVADSVSNRIAAGLSFRGVYGGGNRDYSGWDARLAAGMPLGQMFAIGVGLRYLSLGSNIENDNGDPVGPGVKGFTMDASVRLTPTPGLNIAALAYNIINLDSSIAPTRIGGAASYTIQEVFEIAVDVLVDLRTFEDVTVIYGFGAEALIASQVALRAGYRGDTGRDLHQITMGAGYVDPRFGIEVSMRRDIASQEKETALLFAFRYHIQ